MNVGTTNVKSLTNPYANLSDSRGQIIVNDSNLNPKAKAFHPSFPKNISMDSELNPLISPFDTAKLAVLHCDSRCCMLNPNAKTFVPHSFVRKKVDVSNKISTEEIQTDNSNFLLDFNTSLNNQNLPTTAFSEFSENLNFSNNQSETNMSLLDATPCVNEISTPQLSEVDPYENPKLLVSLPPYFILFCNILCALLYVCICTPIRSSHDSFNNNKCNMSTPLEKENMSYIDDDRDPYKLLKSIKVSNVNRLVIGQLNINSLRNKFEALKLIIGQNIDILFITESKLDETFPKAEFHIDGYSPHFA